MLELEAHCSVVLPGPMVTLLQTSANDEPLMWSLQHGATEEHLANPSSIYRPERSLPGNLLGQCAQSPWMNSLEETCRQHTLQDSNPHLASLCNGTAAYCTRLQLHCRSTSPVRNTAQQSETQSHHSASLAHPVRIRSAVVAGSTRSQKSSLQHAVALHNQHAHAMPGLHQSLRMQQCCTDLVGAGLSCRLAEAVLASDEVQALQPSRCSSCHPISGLGQAELHQAIAAGWAPRQNLQHLWGPCISIHASGPALPCTQFFRSALGVLLSPGNEYRALAHV